MSLMLLAASCNKQRPENLQNIEATPELQAALFDLYPGAQDVKWSMKNSYYVADFKAPAGETPAVRSDNGQLVNYSAWFDSQYQWQMTETDLPQGMVPDAVWAAFDATEYADWRIDDIDMLRRDGVETIYIIEVEGTKDGVYQEVDLYFSEDGVLVKTVIDAEEDYDYNDFIPDTPSGSIQEYIATHYPDARIVEIDIEHGMTEVEIIDGRVCRELFFDSSQNWMLTRTELRHSQVPEDILGYLRSSEYGSYRMDDVDFYQTPEGEFYRFELEYRDDDIEVDVYADGTVTPVTGNGGNPGGGDNSGGMVGVGAGDGWLHNVAAADTDLVFGVLSEEWGLIIAVLAILSIVTLGIFAVRSIKAGRSAFYTIAACAATTLMIFQTILNVFGSVDILPLTGVTFPFVSNGGTSMIVSWGMLAFLKAADTRQNASIAVKDEGLKGDEW